MPEQIAAYLETVQAQIRWKRARPGVVAELRTHLLDQRDACLAAGLDGEAAETEALRQMGDPVEVGTALDRTHRPKPQWALLAAALVLLALGAFLRVFLTMDTPWAPSPVKVPFFAALAAGALLAGYFLDVSALGRHPWAVYGGVLLLALLALWRGPVINHGNYYARYVVLLFPVAYAVVLFSLRGKGWPGLGLALLAGVPLAAVTMLAPSVLGLVSLLGSGILLTLAAVLGGWPGVGRRGGTAAVLGAAAAGGAVFLAYGADHWAGRLALALHPELDPLGSGYMGTMLRETLAGARWLGQGAAPRPESGYTYFELVPEAVSDCLLTTLIHRLGWLPFLLLVTAALAAFVYAAYRCWRQKNVLGRLVSLAVLLTLGAQGLFSLALTLGFVLLSAPFPLIVGNLNTVLDMGLIGLMLSVYRSERLAPEGGVPAAWKGRVKLPRVAWQDGDLIISFRNRSAT